MNDELEENTDIEESTQDSTAEETTTEETQEASTETEEKLEKIEMTQDELQKAMTRERAIAERRAERKINAKYSAEFEKYKANTANTFQAQQNVQQQQPPPNQVWDEVLGYIDPNMSRTDYSLLVAQALNAATVDSNAPQQNANVGHQPAQPVNTPPPAPVNAAVPISEKAWEQVEECRYDIPEFNDDLLVALKAHFITDPMVNAAATSKGGVKALYEAYKKNPTEMGRISKLSIDAQMVEVLRMNEERRQKSLPKVATNPSPNIDSLKGDDVNIKGEDNLSYLEKKKRRYDAGFKNG